MSKLSLFNNTRPSTIAVVDAPVTAGFKRKALIAFWLCTVAGAIVTAGLTAPRTNPVLGAILGGVAGAILGLAVGALLVAWPVMRALWHWSVEISVVLVAYGVLTWLSRTFALWFAALVLAVILAPMSVRCVRARIFALAWCAIVRHRLRMCFAQFLRAAGPASRTAEPLILWSRPTPAGERVWVWLRPGLALPDLEPRLDKLAVACWASEARVVRASGRYAALIRVDISRRDPLTALVPSPLTRLSPRTPVKPNVVAAVEFLGLDLDDIPDIAPIPVTARGRGARPEGR